MNQRVMTIIGLSLLGLAMNACSGHRSTRMVMLSGDRAMANSHYDMAIEEYRYVLSQRPGKVEAQISLGKALLAGEYPDLARDHLEAAYNIRPENDDIVELLAMSMLLQGDLQAMTDLLRDHSEQFPSVRAHLITGRLMEKAGDLDRAGRALQIAASIDGGQSVVPQLALADFHRRLGNNEAAMDRYRMALFVEPNNQAARDAIRAYGEIPGPTLAIPPAEWASAAE